MTVRYADVRRWDDNALETCATDLHGRQYTLIGLQDELDDARRCPTGTARRVRTHAVRWDIRATMLRF
jgi:hypothetical protein